MNAPVRRPAGQGDGVAIVCGAGSLPFEVARSAVQRGRRVVLFPLRGSADPRRVAAYPHHWVGFGQIGRLARLAQAEGCAEMTFIGALVRPTLAQLRPDFETFRLIPRLARLLRGGDGRLLAGVARIFEERGFRIVGAEQFAPQILMPQGVLGSREPGAVDRADIARGLAYLRATGAFEAGQGVIVAEQRIMAVEAAEGTDRMLSHFAELRRAGHIRVPPHAGVLVKAPLPQQDRRIDLPTIGPRTIELAAAAGLNGIAVVAGSAIVAETDRVADLADQARLFVVGMPDEALAS